MKIKVLFLSLVTGTVLFASCNKEKQLINDLEKGEWKLQSVFIRDRSAGNTAEFTETDVPGSIEFGEYDKKKEEGKGYMDLPVYPISYQLQGYNRTQWKGDICYSVSYNNAAQQIDIWTDQDDKWGTIEFYTIREYEKKKRLVLSVFRGDDYYSSYTEYTFAK